MVNKSYAIGYRFERRVKKHMEKEGWNVLRQSKSAFPDLICWKWLSKWFYQVIVVECKCNKYLSKDEKAKAYKLLKEHKCGEFRVAYRKNRKLLFYGLEVEE